MSQPWYREPWPWIIFSGPAIVVVASLFSAWLALTHEDGVVAEDYYKQGLSINQMLRKGTTATTMGVQADFRLEGGRVHIQLTGDSPEYVNLRIVHPTRAGADQRIMLRRTGDGDYSGDMEPVSARHVQLYLEDMTSKWRVSAAWHPQKDSTVLLRPHLD
jgi:hypothetical protein